MNLHRIARIALIAAPIASLGVASLLNAAPAAPDAKSAITARQAGFKKMGGAFKALNDQLKSDAPVKATMLAAAQTIAATAKDQPKFFPVGSGPTSGIKTDALPAIWTDRATFDGQMKKLIAESGKLVAVVNGGNADAIRVQAKATGGTCAACHKQFRADD